MVPINWFTYRVSFVLNSLIIHKILYYEHNFFLWKFIIKVPNLILLITQLLVLSYYFFKGLYNGGDDRSNDHRPQILYHLSMIAIYHYVCWAFQIKTIIRTCFVLTSSIPIDLHTRKSRYSLKPGALATSSSSSVYCMCQYMNRNFIENITVLIPPISELNS